jgi:hypothetical protein
LTVEEFNRIANACLVAEGAEDEARADLHDHGVIVSMLNKWVFDPRWLGLELCNLALYGAVSQYLKDPTVPQILVEMAVEKGLCATTTNDVLLPFGGLPVECPELVILTIRESTAQHRTIFRYPVEIRDGLKCRLVSRVSRLGTKQGAGSSSSSSSSSMRITHLWKDGAVVQTDAELGWLREVDGSWEVCTLPSVQHYGSSAASELYPVLVGCVEEVVKSYIRHPAEVVRIIMCADCQMEKRSPAEQGEVLLSQCREAFQLGEARVECSTQKHSLALREIAPDLGRKFTPEITGVELVKSEVAGTGETRGRFGKKVVAVMELQMEKAVKYSHTDPWQLLYRLCHVVHPNLLHVRGVIQAPLRVVIAVEGSVDMETLMRREVDPLVGESLAVALQERIACDVARGMACVSEVLKVAHGRLCLRNIYLVSVDADSSQSVAKLSVPVDGTVQYDEESWRFQPPEQLQSGNKPEISGDLYAFGMLLYMFSAAGCYSAYKLPFGHKASVHAWRKEEKIEKICEQALRPTMPSLASPAFVKIAYRCWETDPTLRGSFSQILSELSNDEEVDQTIVETEDDTDSNLQDLKLVSRAVADMKDTVLCVALVGGRWIWASTSGPSIVVFDLVENMKQVCEISVPVVVTCLCCVETDALVWGGAQDGTVFMWKKKNGEEWALASQVRHHNNAITAMRAFSDSEYVITGDLSGDLVLWNRRSDFLTRKPQTLSFPKQSVRCVEVGVQGFCFVGLSTSVVKVRLSEENFEVKGCFELPGAAGAAGSISGLLVSDSVWIAGNRSLYVTTTNLVAHQHEMALSKTSKVLALLKIKVGRVFLPCTLSVFSTLDLWDYSHKHVLQTFTDDEAERTQGKGGVLLSCAINVGDNSVLVCRNNQLVFWSLKKS